MNVIKAMLGFGTPKAVGNKANEASNEQKQPHNHQRPEFDGIKAKEPLKSDKLVRFGGCCG
jgi:hypothetical protein